jgi:protoporphyrinogen oxidase
MKLIDIKNIQVLNNELSLQVKGGARDTRTTTTTTTTTATATPATYEGDALIVTVTPPAVVAIIKPTVIVRKR